MEFGVMVAPEQAKLAEERGLSHAWFADVPAVFADPYVSMTLAAAVTRTIKLGTFIAVAPMRTPLAIANSIATVNKLAPGRVVLGLGTGSFSRALAGLPPMKISAFRRDVQTIAGLLRGGEADYETGGLSTKVAFYNVNDWQALNIEDRIPIYIAAGAPKAAAIAGEFGDGMTVSGTTNPAFISSLLKHAREAGEAAGRRRDTRFTCVAEMMVCVLRAGETLESARVIDAVGAWVTAFFRIYASGAMPMEAMPPPARPAFEAWKKHLGVDQFTPEPRHLRLWNGVFQLRPDERRFVVPDMIRHLCLVGDREELIDRIRELEEVGVTHLQAGGNLDDTSDLASRL